MLNELNKTITEYSRELEDFIYGLKNTEDILVELQGYPAYHGEHMEIAIICGDCDNWSVFNHARLCKEFNVHLIDFQIGYTYNKHRIDSEDYFKYIYSGVGNPIKYSERMEYFDYNPFPVRNCTKDKYPNTRMKIHSMLKLIRELDDLELDYEGYIDQSELDIVLNQLECCLEHKDKIPKR